MKQRYKDEVAPKLMKQFGIDNVHALPKIEKIVINVGMGKELEGTKVKPHVVEQVIDTLTVITGQKPVLIAAKKSVATYKTREGYKTHAKVTLRGARMWEFFDRLVTLAVPRIKDFRGLPEKAFDPAGNYSFGVSEQGIFPEVNMAEAKHTHGMNINVIFSNSDPERSRFVLLEMGVPLRRPEGSAAA
jgi:large subunit ribosomal protein L5